MTQKNIAIDQGATYSANLSVLETNGDPKDLTGYTAGAQLRKYYDSVNSVSFSTSLSTGVVTISLSANQTANTLGGRYVYDCEIISNTGIVTRIYEGICTIRPSVTH